jgi:hypothetical protein
MVVILTALPPLLAVPCLLIFDEVLLLWSRTHTCQQRVPELEAAFVTNEIAPQVERRETLVAS